MRYFFCLLALLIKINSNSQELGVKYTLDGFIRLALEKSPDVIEVRNTFITEHYKYLDYKSGYLPSLSFNTTLPNFNRSISWNEETQDIIEKHSLTNNSQLSLSQRIPFTGGTFSASSYLQQINKYGPNSSSTYISSPLSLSYRQPLFGFNSMKWELKTSPVEYEKARRDYISYIEGITKNAVQNFFALAIAQTYLKVAETDYNSLDSLYKIAQERLDIGKISQNDVMQLQLSLLNSKTTLINAQLVLKETKIQAMNFLGLTSEEDMGLILPEKPLVSVLDYQTVLECAKTYNSQLLKSELALMMAKRSLEQAKSERFKVNLDITYGLDHGATSTLPAMYRPPYNDRQQIQVGINMPLIEWGKERRKVRLAKDKEEFAIIQAKQELLSYERSIFLQVTKYNAQDELFDIAAKTYSIAFQRFNISKQRFIIGKIDAEMLNEALKEKDSAEKGYANALRNYWNLYYGLRQTALYNFVSNQPLMDEYKGYIEPK